MTEKDKKHVRAWYWSGAILIFLMVVIGGITRLTGSGLSMVDWQPIMGSIPPLTEVEWQETFDQYKQFPQYNEVNYRMTLSEFKFIFFWEYIHRLIGRLIGLVFIIPFAWFIIKKKMNSRQIKHGILLLILGAGQGLMGWFMVKSGLIDYPRVSHYRLAAHLILAFSIFGFCIWFARGLAPKKSERHSSHKELTKWLSIFIILLTFQIIWGAFVAGLQAGHVYNSFPKMYGYWTPPELWVMEPLFYNFLENIVTVQWIHRVVGTILGLTVISMWIRSFSLKPDHKTRMWNLALFSGVLIQYGIGVFTLIFHVPVWLGVFHQAMALILVGISISFFQYLTQKPVKKTT